LGIKGRVADFLGYNADTGKWLIAESKGNDFGRALTQLQNTMDGLLSKESTAMGNTELRIYTNSAQYQRLLEDPNGVSGYFMKDGFLGWYEGGKDWVYAEINGARVSVLQAP
jgi:hypothetical protein